MAKCPDPNCYNGWIFVGWCPERGCAWLPCPTCGGAREVSCCDGPIGDGAEMPSDPNERREG